METKEQGKPITTTQFAKDEHKTIEVGGDPAKVDAAKAEQDKQMVRVRALRTFHEKADMTGKMLHPDDVFDCPRGRAAQLRANGLIEYEHESEGKKLHGEESHAKIEDRNAADLKSREIDPRNKTTPLRNPKLNLADAPKES